VKYTDIQDLIRAHYESEDKFHSEVDRIIVQENSAGKEIAANKIRSTFNYYSGKRRDGYTVQPLRELSAMTKGGSNMVEIRHSDITLADVIATEETLRPIREVINEFRNRDKLDKYGLEVLNKVLISGPPGVGKTWTAMAIAGELNLELVFVRWDTVVSSYLGSTGANIRRVFEVANERPVVIFLDEFDAAGKERGGGKDLEVGEMSRVVINLLQNIDMFPPESVLIAATNHGHLLDTAIWRRFTVVNMELPNGSARERLIKYHSKGLPIDLNIDTWVKDTQGMSGAEIKTKIHKYAKQQILLGEELSNCV
jgi:AAA+ superfamily predicted ATPase